MIARSLCYAVAMVGLLAGSETAQAAFSCPVQDAGSGGDSMLPANVPLSTNSPDLPQPVLDAVGRLRAANATNGRIVDTLVPAYCKHVAAEAGMADQAKAATVERFASHLAKYLYRSPSSDEEDILLDVPVPQNTFESLATAARQGGISQDAWVNAAIRSKLDGH